jgi:hypothetical protein
MANMVDYLNLHFQSKPIPVIFFFCRHDLPERLLRRTVIGSLTRQPLEQCSGVVEKMENWDSPSLDERETMRRMLKLKKFPFKFKACLVIDGLDECASSERVGLVQDLRSYKTAFHYQFAFLVARHPDILSPSTESGSSWRQLQLRPYLTMQPILRPTLRGTRSSH